MVLRRDETAARQTHKYAHVIRVHNRTDRMVRSGDTEYNYPERRSFELRNGN
jgi:hypothetical protein